MNPNFIFDNYVKRLQLRVPQRISLEILQRIASVAWPSKDADLEQLLTQVKTEFPKDELFQNFDRDFPSYCFALATGVGKTRLMGAFIGYLYLNYGLKNYLILAPNLTIYNKLITDFTPDSPKYVFGGIEEFVLDPPKIITGDNYESGRGVRQDESSFLSETDGQTIHWESSVFVNIFNIAKITAKDKGQFAADDEKRNIPRLRRNNENIGEGGYFQYLANLNDLVVIMDESHQYRADAGMSAINELHPILGLELTATPQIQQGSKKPVPFGNIIYNYPLASAIADGFVKMPAVATRENFNPNLYDDAQLEQLKLQDGIHLHEETKAELAAYAKNNDVPKVKPFVLVIARDTTHAEELKKKIESEDFFNGKYIGKVITVHSNTKGAEKDDVIEQLLTVEKIDNPIEIVIHVNMLKEGWDVTNLYTIIPLRTADSQTLVEQSIGRGLRLPYGKRTGVDAVDRLTIVAHDHFEDIVNKANEGSLHYNVEKLIIKTDEPGKKTVPQYSIFTTPADNADGAESSEEWIRHLTASATPEELRTVRPELLTQVKTEIVNNQTLNPGESLRSSEYVSRITRSVVQQMFPFAKDTNDQERKQVEKECQQAVESLTKLVIEIPRILMMPKEATLFNYIPFKLDTKHLHFEPIESDILIENLDRSGIQKTLSKGSGEIQNEERLEDYLVRELIGYNGIDYDDNADLLYDLCGQAIAYFRTYLKDNDELLNVLTHFEKKIAAEIFEQMQRSMEEREAEYEVIIADSRAIVESRVNNNISESETVRDFRDVLQPGERNQIKTMVFGGYKKSIFFPLKFDSYSELEFVRFLESKPKVEKWLRPDTRQIRITWKQDSSYKPDFIVETTEAMLMVEIKRKGELDDEEVRAKAKAAKLWCEHATKFAEEHGGKPWKYVLIPHDEISSSMSVEAVVKKQEWKNN